MKKATLPVIAFLLAICFVACTKETLNTTLEASKTRSIQKGEPVIFTLPLSAAGDSVTWSVNPSANTTISGWGDSALILFGAAGNYTVTATFGNSIVTSSISVIDSAYTDSTSYISMLVPGEEINIFLYHWPDLDSNKIANLIFLAQTTNSYNCVNNYLLAELIPDPNRNVIKYYGVSVTGKLY